MPKTASNQDAYALSIGMRPAAFREALDLHEGKYTLSHIRKTLRTQYHTVMTNKQWAAIKEFHAAQK